MAVLTKHPPEPGPAAAEQRAGEPAIRLRGVTVERGGQPIIHDLSLEIPRGVVFGLVGPSGSGKTTLMRALLGLSRVVTGTGAIFGRPVGSADLRPVIGYMPQGAAVYPDLTGRENLAFFASVYRVPAARIEEILRLVDLLPIADRPVATYSGGERQRVSLAAALLPEPRLLILDEPTVGLDPRLRQRLWAQFAAWAASGVSLLVSTHVMDEAARTDRLAFLAEGRLVATGTPAELRARAGAHDLESAVLRLTGGEPVERSV